MKTRDRIFAALLASAAALIPSTARADEAARVGLAIGAGASFAGSVAAFSVAGARSAQSGAEFSPGYGVLLGAGGAMLLGSVGMLAASAEQPPPELAIDAGGIGIRF